MEHRVKPVMTMTRGRLRAASFFVFDLVADIRESGYPVWVPAFAGMNGFYRLHSLLK
jgi:hypothetical protein